MNGSHDTEMYGRCCKAEGADVGNGPTASACYAARLAVVLDGCGAQRIVSGPRSTQSTRGDGSTSTHAKGHGTIPGCTPKVCYTLLHWFPPRPHSTDAESTGWGWKLSYCIAFSNDGATDVTRRYIRNPATHGAGRNKVPEEVLLWIINEIRRLRREPLSKEDRHRLIREDQREERELRNYVVSALATEIERMIQPASPSTASTAGPKLPARPTGTAQWMQARGENGVGEPGSDQPPREGH